MGQVTEETCRFIIEYADRDERFPLTVNEMRQLAYLANQQIRAARRTAPDRDAIIEECAKVCDEHAKTSYLVEAVTCARKIRSLKTTPTAASTEES
ncbi:hypothetical protein [Burkholderia multivorans]|uniref:hypothetical protein n=1 Tax=Burkholderia multivorans TaxID=87883 RepID=UPI00201874EA|nr:hypothetical protein [Burkholderia multivorans]MCO1382577.1 hypothetical protein [Burkholderia multivorans]MCO1402711.1 hypothetical protein [Burkholderia multivorans]UQO78756.1 hypothetical protein L0Z12_06970 [Burkholderia multivorans]